MFTSHSEHEAKYNVADILSSMSGSPATLNTPTYAKYTYGITQAPPTLTPTTLNNIEQTFIELQSNQNEDSNHSNHSGSLPASRQFQSGFVPPSVHTSAMSDSSTSRDSDWGPVHDMSGVKKLKTNSRTAVLTEADIYTPGYLSTSRKPPQRRKDDQVTGEEANRRLVRRERNKVAAAKCRQRRVDQTNILLVETDKLDGERNEIENEIQSLQQQKEHLEFLLQAHRPLCKLQQNHQQARIITSDVKIKSEPGEFEDSVVPFPVTEFKARPTSLSLHVKTPVSTAALGIPITTPSSGMFTYGFDHMVDGHTGLTPLTGIASCSTQHLQKHGDGSSPELNSPTLMAL